MDGFHKRRSGIFQERPSQWDPGTKPGAEEKMWNYVQFLTFSCTKLRINDGTLCKTRYKNIPNIQWGRFVPPNLRLWVCHWPGLFFGDWQRFRPDVGVVGIAGSWLTAICWFYRFQIHLRSFSWIWCCWTIDAQQRPILDYYPMTDWLIDWRSLTALGKSRSTQSTFGT